MNVFKLKKWIPDKGKRRLWESPCYYVSVFDPAKGRNVDRPVHKVVGYDEGITVKVQALDLLADWRKKRANGFIGINTPVNKPLTEFYQEYLDDKFKKDRTGTFKPRKRIVESWCEFLHENRVIHISQVTPELVGEYFTQLDENLTDRTKNRRLDIIKNSFRYAYRKNYLRPNPLSDYQRFSDKGPEMAVEYSSAEIDRLVEFADPNFRDYVVVEYYTGLRRVEVYHLQWPQFDWENNEIKIHPHEGFQIPKRGHSRNVPLHPDLRQYLMSIQPRFKYVIDSGRNTPRYHLDTITHKFTELRKRVGIEKGRLHDLRGTNITKITRESNDPKIAQRNAGHESLWTTLNFYRKVSSEDLHRAVAKLPSISCLIPVKNNNKGVLMATNGNISVSERMAVSV